MLTEGDLLSYTSGSGSLKTQAQHLMLLYSQKFRKNLSIRPNRDLRPAHTQDCALTIRTEEYVC